MKPILLLFLAVASPIACRAQTNWYTPEVAWQLQQELPANTPASPSPFRTTEFALSACRIRAAQIACFDTIASYAQGRVVNGQTYRPIRGATVEVTSSCYRFPNSCAIRTAVTDSAGFFRLGWVGCGGPEPRQNRPLRIRAVGYPEVNTQQVGFGGQAYLHIELRTMPRGR